MGGEGMKVPPQGSELPAHPLPTHDLFSSAAPYHLPPARRRRSSTLPHPALLLCPPTVGAAPLPTHRRRRSQSTPAVADRQLTTFRRPSVSLFPFGAAPPAYRSSDGTIGKKMNSLKPSMAMPFSCWCTILTVTITGRLSCHRAYNKLINRLSQRLDPIDWATAPAISSRSHKSSLQSPSSDSTSKNPWKSYSNGDRSTTPEFDDNASLVGAAP